jgi:uncharacterized protein DUF1521
MSNHTVRIHGDVSVDIGKYEINVRNSRFGSFAEVRKQNGKLVEILRDGESERLRGGTTVSFDSDRRGQVITVTDPKGRDCRPEQSDRDCRPSLPTRPGGGNSPGRGFDVDEWKNAVDTGRYLIQASGKDDGELKVYDNYTGQWVRAWGDPHLETSDEDTGDFSKRFTLNLDDGTKITIVSTDGENPHLKEAVITKGDHAAVIRYDKDHNPTTEELRGREARSADRDTPDGTDVYTIRGNLDDLVFGGRRGEEFKGKHVDIDDLAHCSDRLRRTCDPYRY